MRLTPTELSRPPQLKTEWFQKEAVFQRNLNRALMGPMCRLYKSPKMTRTSIGLEPFSKQKDSFSKILKKVTLLEIVPC
jgi:hypothetical protein